MYYILNGKEITTTNDVHEWAKQFEKGGRRVAYDEIGDAKVSTVFLGVDHNYDGGEPILFETMIFGGEFDQYQERYCTYDEAVKGHNIACQMVTISNQNV